MKETQEDYVQSDNEGTDESLITKLRLRIEQDLKQINGVYDVQIAEAEEINRKLCMKIQSIMM